MISKRILLLVVFVLVGLPAVVRGQNDPAPEPAPLPLVGTGDTAETNISLEASQDAFIASALPNERFGISSPTVLGLGHRPDNGAQRVLVQFDLNSLPDNAQISKAELILTTAVGIPSQDPPMGTELRFLRGPWSEQLVTWGNAPERGNVVANADVLTVSNAQTVWDITGLVQEWVSGDRDNNGLIIIGDENPAVTRVRNFHAKDALSAPVGLRPRLFITYDEDNTPPTMTMNDLPESSTGPFSVSWTGEDNEGGSGIAHYRIEYRRDFGDWQVWLEETEAGSAVFDIGTAGSVYNFRGKATDNAGNESDYSNEVSILYGVRPPTSVMNPLPAITQADSFDVSWRTIEDGGAPIDRYRLHFRFNNEGWQVWSDGLTATTIKFFPFRGDGLYAFSVQAINEFNLEEPFKDRRETSTFIDREAPFIEPQVYLPLVAK